MSTTAVRYGGQVRDSFAAWNRGDVDAHMALYAEDAVLAGPFFPEPLVGRAAIAETDEAMSTAFPDMTLTILSMLEDGNRVACEVRIEGTHTGPMPSPAGPIPPTGRGISLEVSMVFECNEDGLVTEHREYMDVGTFLTQLGLAGE